MASLDRRQYFEAWQTLTVRFNRKQSPQPPKAWQGPNPITQRANSSAALPNGNEKSQSRSPAQSQQGINTPSHAESDAHDRLLYLLAHCKVSDPGCLIDLPDPDVTAAYGLLTDIIRRALMLPSH